MGQATDILNEWRESAKYWTRHNTTIRQMFAPLTQALIDRAGCLLGYAQAREVESFRQAAGFELDVGIGRVDGEIGPLTGTVGSDGERIGESVAV